MRVSTARDLVAERPVRGLGEISKSDWKESEIEPGGSSATAGLPILLVAASSALSEAPRGLIRTIRWAITNTYPEKDKLELAVLTERTVAFILDND